jgi:hypothetical protein
MLKVLEETQSDLLAMRATGKIDVHDVEKVNPLLDKMLKDFEEPKIYIEFHELDMPSAEAVWKDLKNTPKYNKFEKCAVVGSKKWLEILTNFASPIMKTEVKYFNFDEKADAMEWLNESSPRQ